MYAVVLSKVCQSAALLCFSQFVSSVHLEPENLLDYTISKPCHIVGKMHMLISSRVNLNQITRSGQLLPFLVRPIESFSFKKPDVII